MEGKRTLRSVSLRNILSFGPEGMTLGMEPLNVLIGANGSGKSNFIEALGLLKALPNDLPGAISRGGGISHWLYQGQGGQRSAEIETEWSIDNNAPTLQHAISFRGSGRLPEIVAEALTDRTGRTGGRTHDHYRYSRLDGTRYTGPDDHDALDDRLVAANSEFRTDQSVFAQLRNPVRHPALTTLGRLLLELRLYRDWRFGPESPLRKPQRADLPTDFLAEDCGNLVSILKELQSRPAAWASLISHFKEVYEECDQIQIIEILDYLNFAVHEYPREDRTFRLVPPARLSDGTLRFLSLLAVLCHPEPPPLVCLEEPELGLHPDLIRTVAGLLIDATSRTQLVVTTHSADLISALWEFPESVVVCEGGCKGTEMKRLDPERLANWLEDYSLGQLWMNGEIGGNRW